MSEQQSTPIPWASLVVIATFVSGSFLAPRAFDLMRPAEKDRAQSLVAAPLEVDARLWEDPFVAARRHEEERLQRCQKARAADPKAQPSPDCDATALLERRKPKALRDRLDADRDGDITDSLVLTVLLPGNPFVGAEESRRRMRYAVLAGLQADGYLPDEIERIGLVGVELPSAAKGTRSELLVPYELMSDRRMLTGRVDHPSSRYRSVLVLWLDEAALPMPKLDGFAYALQAIVGACTRTPQLALIGPSSSEGLRQALRRLDDLAFRPDDKGTAPLSTEARAGYRLLARTHVLNNAATIDDSLLTRTAKGSVQAYVRERLQRIVGSVDKPLRFERTIATDDELVDRLLAELKLRGSGAGGRRVVTITESDSVHARSMRDRLMHELNEQESKLPPDRWRGPRPEDDVYFFRGIDGVTLREGSDRSPDAAAKPKEKDDEKPNIEWPESRDQLDYLRRMANELKRSETVPVGNAKRAEPIGAIGIFATDVHDKLLILQALHETFSDKVFFTTDMDARLLHPRMLPYTRNLIVASSLPLQFPIKRPASASASPPLPIGTAIAATPAAPASWPAQLHTGTPPFRDVIQSATYVAARLAVCEPRCEDIQAQLKAALAEPSVYEIGRDQAILLRGLDIEQRRKFERMRGYFVGIGAFVLLTTFAVLVWPGAPSVGALRDAASCDVPTAAPRMASGFIAAYGALVGAMVASTAEVIAPGCLGPVGVVIWSLLGGLAAPCLHLGMARIGKPPLQQHAAWGPRIALVCALVLVGIAPLALKLHAFETPVEGEPMAWTQGISGWPSHFLTLLALVAGVVSLDLAWNRMTRSRAADEAWLALPVRPIRLRTLRALGGWVRRHTLLFWQTGRRPGAVEFATLWPQFLRRGTTAPRVMRIVFWYAVTVATVVLLFTTLSDRGLPEVPVRGLEHRTIVRYTLFVALLLLPLVVIVVADATMLCWRFIRLLSRGRTLYPPATVERFARELGTEQLAAWCEAIDAKPARRRDGHPPAAAHSLLDDWIDMRIVARRTAVVAPLVLAPFVMLALMVLARSRLFDNWALTWPIAVSVALYVLWLGLLAWLLKDAAEQARRRALARMNADVRWLAGAGAARAALVAPMQRLIAAVESDRRGAFAPLLDQWFFKGLLVPLGGAGGAQLLERLLAP